ncbi:hypothetical protein ACRAWD_09185 [Caulobacter segnis]
MFPRLESAEIDRLRRFGQVIQRRGRRGPGYGRRPLARPVRRPGRPRGDQPPRRSMTTRQPIVEHAAGQFIGEIAQLSGRPSLVDVTALTPVDALLIAPERLRAVLVAEAELGERIMRALILRRVSLIETGAGGPIIIGREADAEVIRLSGFLARNGHPYQHLDPDQMDCAKVLIQRFEVDEANCRSCCAQTGPSCASRPITSWAAASAWWARSTPTGSMTWPWSGPAPRAWPPPSMPLRKASVGAGAGQPGVRRPGRGLGADRKLSGLP